MDEAELAAIEREFLRICGVHDYGVPTGCGCPGPGRDYRAAMGDLIDEVRRLRGELAARARKELA